MNTEQAVAKAERVEAWMKGKAPMIDKENYKMSIIKALNYHNEFTDLKDLRKIALAHYKNDPSVSFLSQATDEELRQIGILVQYVDALQEKEHLKLVNSVSALVNKYSSAPKVETKPKVVVLKQVVDKVEQEAQKIAEKIDAEIDTLFTLKSDGKFDIEVYLDNCKPTLAVCKKLMEYYADFYNELVEVIEGEDEQLNEGYASYPKPRIKRIHHSFVVPMWEKLEKMAKQAKVDRKPRKRKAKPASAVVKAVQYMKEFPELKLKSIEPQKIVGASQLWVYNTRYKKLTQFIAVDGSGLSVKGTTVVGFDVDKSMTKVVRKPDLVLAEINKRKLAFHMKQMKTNGQEVNGRLGKDTIILTV